jgi:beta-lactamase regulating signal transducer with metallopeptidase domain
MSGLYSIAPSIAGGAINSFLFGLAIALLVRLLLWSVARCHPAIRFALLYSALVGIVASFFWRASDHQAVTDAGASTIALPSQLAIYLVCAWAAIASVGLIRIGAGLWRLRALRKSFVRLDSEDLDSLLRTRRGREAALFVSDHVRVPTAFGFFRPAVVLPRWSVSELSRQELRTAVLHELAHVDRWDDWTNLGQKVIRALLFFHPAVWWIDSRLAIEREMSCDDVVLAQSSSPQSYAECLVSIAEKSFVQKQIAFAHAAVGHVKQTAFRIAKILDGRKRESVSTWKPALAAVTTFSLLGALAVEHTPRLVGFENPHAATARVAVAENIEPHIVPASLRNVPGSNKVTPSSARKHAIAKPVHKNDSQNYIARQSNHLMPQPKAVNAGASHQASPQFMLVVFQTREYDGSGIVTVTTTVWRMRVGNKAQMRSEVASLPHST